MIPSLLAAAIVAPTLIMDTQDTRIGESSTLGDKLPLEGEEIAVMETKFGRILLRFYADKAPNHVANFKKLANEKFYDKTIFHRVIPGFMIQGGDPNTKGTDTSLYGTGGPETRVKAEFNDVKHERGILSMARSSDPDSAGSQFFLMHKQSTHLDGAYSAFGRIVRDGTEKENEEPAGLAVVDKIVNQPRNQRDMPNERTEMTVSIQKWPIK